MDPGLIFLIGTFCIFCAMLAFVFLRRVNRFLIFLLAAAFACFGIALGFIAWEVYQLGIGHIPAGRRTTSEITRGQHPELFWSSVLLGVAGLLLLLSGYLLRIAFMRRMSRLNIGGNPQMRLDYLKSLRSKRFLFWFIFLNIWPLVLVLLARLQIPYVSQVASILSFLAILFWINIPGLPLAMLGVFRAEEFGALPGPFGYVIIVLFWTLVAYAITRFFDRRAQKQASQ